MLPSFVCVARERRLLDDGWRFSQGDDREASQREFDDSQWRQVRLPHDWSIEGVPHIDAPSGSGGGYLPTGVGW
ncbi:MAG TPA: hypothetical protein PKC18_09825, partial [Lacipirellulaceae bacterium]|nr:hypothetical protein [Lacipirellulaceae bacterium]